MHKIIFLREIKFGYVPIHFGKCRFPRITVGILFPLTERMCRQCFADRRRPIRLASNVIQVPLSFKVGVDLVCHLSENALEAVTVPRHIVQMLEIWAFVVRVLRLFKGDVQQLVQFVLADAKITPGPLDLKLDTEVLIWLRNVSLRIHAKPCIDTVGGFDVIPFVSRPEALLKRICHQVFDFTNCVLFHFLPSLLFPAVNCDDGEFISVRDHFENRSAELHRKILFRRNCRVHTDKQRCNIQLVV